MLWKLCYILQDIYLIIQSVYIVGLYRDSMKKGYIVLGLALILAAGITVQADAHGGHNDAHAKVRAIQNGNSLSTDPGTEGILGVDIDCVGGTSHNQTNDFHCFLVPEGVAPGQYDWDELIDGTNLPNGVILLNTTTTIPCPNGVGFMPTDTCLAVTFDGSNFNQEGEWHFIGVFTEDGDIVDLTGSKEFRVHSFLVLPEASLGAFAVIGSIFAAFIGYNYMRRRSSF